MLERLKKILYRSMLNNDINYNDAQKILKDSTNTILLDVRSVQEYNEGHLPNSINLSLYDVEKQVRAIVPDKHTNVIVYCSSGNRSKQAQKILENMGYENVYNIKGGLDKIE